MSRLQLLLDELKRRRVFRVAAAYAVVAFVIWQAADFVFPALKVPDWVATTVVIVTLLGFPVALALAWALDADREILRARKSRRLREEPTQSATWLYAQVHYEVDVAGQITSRNGSSAVELVESSGREGPEMI
jgi:hypothetical protein